MRAPSRDGLSTAAGDIELGIPELRSGSFLPSLLERAWVVDTAPNPHGRGSLYCLTDAGHELAQVAKVLGGGARWTEMGVEHVDPYPVLWGKCWTWDFSKLPRSRIVIQFDISDFRQPQWVLVQESAAEVSNRLKDGSL